MAAIKSKTLMKVAKIGYGHYAARRRTLIIFITSK
jgi:hypothetical protein